MPQSIIITGASSGIGAEAARQLSERREYALILCARSEEALNNVAQEVSSAGSKVATIVGDICDAETREELCTKALEFGPIHGLVNNAGFGQPGPVELVSEEHARRQFDVNFFALAEMTRCVLPHMRKERAGRIVNVSSILGRISIPLFGWYCASKHAVDALSDSLRSEVRPFGIRVSLVEPGPIATGFTQAADKASENFTLDADNDYVNHQAALRLNVSQRFSKIGAHPRGTAKTIVHALTAKRPKYIYRTTFLSRFASVMSWATPRALWNAMTARVYGV